MKVGIITPYDSRNFGNRLQNYALQQILLRYADSVVTIKNKPALPSMLDRIRRKTPLAESVLVNKLLGDGRKARILRFNRKHLHLSRNVYWHNRPCPQLKAEDACDLYCAGSDQIWNPELGRAGAFNFLGFGERNTAFSYAASFGIDKIPQQYADDIRRGLQNIRFLSVREEAGRQIVEALTGRTDVWVLPDPTLLLTRQEWDAVMEKPKKKLPEKYLLAYFLGAVSRERQSAIREKAAALGCKILSIMEKGSPFYEIGPGEFLFLISHAALVCTDSFHGSVFSFLYQRPLILFDRAGEQRNMGSRLETLVSKFCLQGCAASEEAMPEVPESPDYAAGYAALEEEREKAHAFLNMVFRAERNETRT